MVLVLIFPVVFAFNVTRKLKKICLVLRHLEIFCAAPNLLRGRLNSEGTPIKDIGVNQFVETWLNWRGGGSR